MNIVLALHHPGAFRSLEGVVRNLCGSGHKVNVVYGYMEKQIAVDRALKLCQTELRNFESEPILSRKNWLPLANVRELINYINYLRPHHPNPWQAERWKYTIIRHYKKALKKKTIYRVLKYPRMRQALKKVELVIPCDPAIKRWLEVKRPDLVVASPFIFPESQELEYVKAAEALKIPTVVVVLSWDNLTSKGTFHIIPDLTLVWNNVLAKEAMTLHDVPKDKIFVTGAPPFDFWFEMAPSLDRASFCSHLGIDPGKPFILYLCSSAFIAGDETTFVKEINRTLSENPNTREVNIVVRPHPLNASIWNGFRAENITVWPDGGEWVDVDSARQDYYNTIFHSTAVMGVNTSAFLEAAILNRPCVTVMTERYRSTQTGVGHFRHLLDGDFLKVANSYPEAASILATILTGSDSKEEQRRRFVREFIRPWGMNTSASKIMAIAIEAAALREDINQIMKA
jgi:hypothetical protein